jgi:ankyrin repeat protein
MTLARRLPVLLAIVALGLAPVASAPPEKPAAPPAPPAQDKPKTDAKNPAQGQIIELVMTADLDGLKKLVTEDPSQADFVGPGDMTPLGIALARRNQPLIDTLLHAGADPNKPFGPLKMHPIQGASASGNLEAVKELLAKGADPNKTDINGGTALHAAMLYGKEDIGKALVEKGANVNAVFTGGPNKGAAPLHFAARSKKVTLVMVVAVPSADWTLKWNGKTPAELADAVGAKDVGDYIRGKEQPKS